MATSWEDVFAATSGLAATVVAGFFVWLYLSGRLDLQVAAALAALNLAVAVYALWQVTRPSAEQ